MRHGRQDGGPADSRPNADPHAQRERRDGPLTGDILTLFALAFGPLTHKLLLSACREAGLRMPDGSVVTDPKLRSILRTMDAAGLLVREKGTNQLMCDPEDRRKVLDLARRQGRLLPLGRAMQEVSRAADAGSRYGSAYYGRVYRTRERDLRDVLLALESGDEGELLDVLEMCEQGSGPGAEEALHTLLMRPLQRGRLESLPVPWYAQILVYGLYLSLFDVTTDDEVFPYAAEVLDAPPAEFSVTDRALLANFLTERHVLRGDLPEARRMLDKMPEETLSPMQGVCELLSGNLEAAREALADSASIAGPNKAGKQSHLRTLPGVLHMLLLLHSEKPADQKLASKWLRWGRDDPDSSYTESYRILDLLQQHREGLNFRWRHPPHSRGPLLSIAASAILLLLVGDETGVWPEGFDKEAPSRPAKTFSLGPVDWLTFKKIQKIARLLWKHGAKWLSVQLATLLDRAGEPIKGMETAPADFLERAGLRDLATLWPRVSTWDRQLSAVETLLAGGADAGIQADRRLGWKLKEGWDETLHVVPVEQKLTKSGRWTKGREISVSRLGDRRQEELPYLSEQDRAAVTRLMADHSYGLYELRAERALLALVGHPNVFWDSDPAHPVEIVRDEPRLQVRRKGDSWYVSLTPACDEYFGHESPPCRIVRESASRVRVIAFTATHRKLTEILGDSGLRVPTADWQEASARVAGLARHIAMESTQAEVAFGQVTMVESDSRPRLRLSRLAEGLRADLVVQPLGEGSASTFAPGEGGAHLMETVDGKAVQTQRDFTRELSRARAAIVAVPALQNADDSGAFSWNLDAPTAALELLEQLQDLPEDVLTVEWLQEEPIRVSRPGPGQMSLSVRKARDWFEVDGTVQVRDDLVVEMRQLLESLETTGSRFVKVGENEFLALTEEMRRLLRRLADSGQFRGKSGRLRLHPLAAMGLADGAPPGVAMKTDKAFDAHIERFRQLADYQPALPSTLRAELRPYQEEGFTWLARLAKWGVGACLADDMGLGKTVQALAAVLLRAAEGPTLVVAPTSVCANWISEAARFTPTLKPIRLGAADGSSRADVVGSLGAFDLLVCSYTMLQQEAEILQQAEFVTIVLDEAQAIKNAQTKRSQAAMGLEGAFRIVCTGTPIENHLEELWNLFRFLNPGLLGSRERFRRRFAVPIQRDRDPHARFVLKSLIAPFLLRRTKAQVLEELPARTETTVRVELSPREMALHETLRRQALERLEGPGQADGEPGRMHIFAELMKLRRCCCHPRLVLPDAPPDGAKLQAFGELVDHLLANHHKALVFSQFTAHLALLREYLDGREIAYQYLDGQTPAKTRQSRIDAFQNGQGELFLISLKAGGTGLNLTAADFVIHMDPWWNPAVEDQASDRAHRIGQTRPVTVYRLVAAGTIEEKIVALHREKRELSDSLLSGADAATKLSVADLLALLR